jgi:phospholipid/cholesterol/gamma-HCH transport system substrate-binding protein
MKNTLETRLGLFVALAVLAAVLIMETLGGPEWFRRGYHLNSEFNNAQDLKLGAQVKMAGVEVGKVEKIGLDETNNKVRITMKLRRDVIVRTDSTATIKFTGLLGQNFVSLDFGSPSSPKAADGAMLASVEQPDLSAMMQKLDNVATGVENLTKSFTGVKIDDLLGPLTDFLKANRGPLTATIANFQAISAEISAGKGTVGKMINDDALYNSLYNTATNLQDVGSDIKATIADARGLLDQAKTGNGTVGKLINDDKLYREAADAMANLRQVLEKVNQGQGSIGKIVNDKEFYNNAKLTLQKLDKATEGLEDQGPLSVLGLIVNNLF